MNCDNCGSALLEIPRRSRRDRMGYRCPACELYSAAVSACQAAALTLTKERYPRAKEIGRVWLNEFGFFADVDGVILPVGSAAEAAPFAALTSAALNAGRI